MDSSECERPLLRWRTGLPLSDAKERTEGRRRRGGGGSGWPNALPALLFTCLLLMDVVQSDLTLPLNTIQKWAETFGQKIYSAAERATALTDIQTEYLLMYPDVKPQNGSQLVQELKERLEKLFNRKVRAINRLVDVAEKSFASHVMRDKLEITYPKAKNLTGFALVKNDRFNGVPVNLTHSSIHVPTNVYDESIAILNGVAWTDALDKTFHENYQNDHSLSWQYFGSSTGFLRNFPGLQWPKPEEVDLYDCRTRGWYIQAATTPKDMIILLDSSGSMKGLRMEIAKATVKKIVETLNDDDFFNVIKFAEMPEYLEACFNGTMVQATTSNKVKIKGKLDKGIKTQNIAYFDRALTLAFELLLSTNSTGQGSQCNKAIMVITDGVPDTYEAIFRQYNWPHQDVRVFTYLIGREVGDTRHVRWMACSNKGYYSHISTLADVHEHVQEYIHVISRPMVIMRANQTVWTSIYRDTSGVHMILSVAKPVYNIKNGTANSGDLLGVMGTDIPLEQLISQIPHHKLGVDGYAFAITNNGYVLFHPDLRAPHNGELKPNYNSVDLSEVELLDNHSTQLGSTETLSEENELRRKLIDRETGTMRMKMRIHFDQMKRATTRYYNYFFTPIENTPFSLAVALPDEYGMYWVDGTRQLKNSDLSDFRTSEIPVLLADWDYCRPQNSNDSRLQRLEFLLKSLERGKKDAKYFHKHCDVDLVSSLLFDAEATRAIPNSWRKENSAGTANDSTSRKNGIEMVFIATKGGLTRYLTFVENLTDPDFILKQKDTVREIFYSRAVAGGEGVFTFSVPILKDQDRIDRNDAVISATTPVFVSSEAGMAVAAVTGLQMTYSRFQELFLGVTSHCVNPDDTPCNVTCDSEIVDCYLLDNNGFVLFSKTPEEHLGRFFGEIDGSLMTRLIRDENRTTGGSDGVFSKIEIIDFQGMCSIWRKAHCDARSIFADPLRNLIVSLWWLLQRLILLVVSFTEFIWCADEMTMTTGNLSFSDYEPEGSWSARDDYFAPDITDLYRIANNNSDLVREWLNEWRALNVKGASVKDLRRWLQAIVDKYTPRVIASRPCTTTAVLYEARPPTIVFDSLPDCRSASSGCDKSFSLVPVYRTNLLLLVVDATCSCDSNDRKVNLDPIELNPTPDVSDACPVSETGEREPCLKEEPEVYRRRPAHCYSFHEHENSTRCGATTAGVNFLSVFALSTLTVTSSSASVWLQQQQL